MRVIDRVDLGPRLMVALVETGGRRYLVTTGASVTPLPLEEPSSWAPGLMAAAPIALPEAGANPVGLLWSWRA